MLNPAKVGLNTFCRFGWRGACRGAYPEYFISFYWGFFWGGGGGGGHCLYRHHGCLQVKNFQFLKPQGPFKNVSWGVEYSSLLTYITQQLTSFTKKIILNDSKRELMIANLLLTSILSTQWKSSNYFQCKFLCLHQTFLDWQFCCFTKRKSFQIFGQFRKLLKETSSKNWGFCVEKKRREKKKTGKIKVAVPCHKVAWAQRSWRKRES